MRRLSCLVLLLSLVIPAAAFAATSPVGSSDLTGSVGYQYWGTRPYYYGYNGYSGGELHLNANVNYSGEFTSHVRPYEAVQLSYSYQTTDLVLQGATGGTGNTTLAKTTVQYIHLYGMREMPSASGVTSFVKFGMGATGYSPKGYDSVWLFSIGLGLGVEKPLNDKVSLKLTQRFLVPIQWASGGFYFGTGGSGVTVGGGSSIIQGDTSLGLTFKLQGAR